MKLNFRNFFIVITLILSSTKLFAQDGGAVEGKLIEAKTNVAVAYAAVFLAEQADSTRRSGAIASAEGTFSFKNVKDGKYLVKISALGFKPVVRNITVNGKPVNLGDIRMEEDAISLQEVGIGGRYAAAKIKGDTVEFNADAYKTKPNAAVEELLKKLPGVEIDKDGNILVQGQKVSRLTVDGKDFFGTDPKTATKNLPADAIAKVQIVDSKTQEAKATGIDDGQREKVLNLTIKADKKNGWFGNANLAGGTTEKYNSYLSANHFNKDLQFAVLGMSNNVNNASFGFEDLQSFTGGNIGNIFAPPGGGSFSINVNNGKTTIGGSGVFDNNAIGAVTTHSGGLNYSNSWGRKSTLSLSLSYFTYFSSGLGDRSSSISDVVKDDRLRTEELSSRNSDNQAHRFNLKAEYHPDSLTDIVFRPNVILNKTTNITNRVFSAAYDLSGKANNGDQYLNQENYTPSLFGEFSVLRRMANKKGSVSLRLNGTQNTFNSDYINRSMIREYVSGAPVTSSTNQQTGQENVSKSYTVNANYVRPVFNSSKWNASVGYIFNRSFVDASQETLDYDPVSGNYQAVVPEFTNRFDNENYLQALRLGLIYARTEWTWNFGLGLQETGLDAAIYTSADLPGGSISRDYYNLLPRLTVNYKNKNNQTLSINYNMNVIMPSVNDLQPVKNNTNTIYEREGNPDLEARKSHRIALNFNTFSPDNNKYWNGYFLYNLTFSDVSTSVTNVGGRQLAKPINVDGNFYINTGTYFGGPAKLKNMRMGYGMNVYIDHRTGFVNALKNITNRYNFGPTANISYDIDEKLNAGIFLAPGYNVVTNSAQGTVNDNYLSFNNSANLNYELFKNFNIDMTLEHIGSAGREKGFNNNAFLLNAGLEKYFMERRFTLSLRGFDILKQNTTIDRSVNGLRTEDYRFNNITRYFYLGLNYKIAKAGASSQRNNPRSTVN